MGDTVDPIRVIDNLLAEIRRLTLDNAKLRAALDERIETEAMEAAALAALAGPPGMGD